MDGQCLNHRRAISAPGQLSKDAHFWEAQMGWLPTLHILTAWVYLHRELSIPCCRGLTASATGLRAVLRLTHSRTQGLSKKGLDAPVHLSTVLGVSIPGTHREKSALEDHEGALSLGRVGNCPSVRGVAGEAS